MIDPFADAIENTPAPEPETANDANVPAPVDADVKPVLTFKGGRDFDAAWVVLHCESTADALAATRDPQLKELLERTKKIGEQFSGSAGGGAAPRPAPATGNQARDLPPGVPEIQCEHGRRNYVSKANWAALFCAAPQGTPDEQKCTPLWRDKFGNYKAK